jgi:hypothetical protein
MGQPIPFGSEEIVQADSWHLDGPAVIEVRFLDDEIFAEQAVRLSFKKKGQIFLSDGEKVRVLRIHDHEDLPRFIRHFVDPKGEPLLVSNSYLVERSGQEVWESWTHNAGMIAIPVTSTTRRYECSSGPGSFDRSDLRFEVSILPADALWLPKDVY